MKESGSLLSLRREIDRIDLELLRLLSRRAGLALRVGGLKKKRGLPVFDPKREVAVLRRPTAANRGPMPASAVRTIFSGILRCNRRIQVSGKESLRKGSSR